MKALIVYLFPFTFFYAAGQQPGIINTKLPALSDTAIDLIFAGRNEASAIYNGRIFYGYPSTQSFAFYLSKDWQKGSVLYEGTWYHDIFMMYDIYQDELVVRHPSIIPVRLYSEWVQQFNFGEQTFIRLHPDKDNVIKTGFYQQLSMGKVTILAFRHKLIEENTENLRVEQNFVPVNFYYALKDGNYYPITKQKSLLNLLKDSRQDILKHLKKQGLKYRKDKEKTIVQAAEFYNQSFK